MDSPSFLSRLYLKYCECCGGLWLRPEDALTPYCPSCERFLARLPARPPRADRKPRHRATAAAAVAVYALLALCPPDLLLGGYA